MLKSLFFQLGRKLRSPLLDSGFRRNNFRNRRPPLEKRVSPNTVTNAVPKRFWPARKFQLNWYQFDHHLPSEDNPKPDLRVWAPLQMKKNSKFAFYLQNTAFEHQKSVTKFQFKQTSCDVISEPSSNILMLNIFSGLVDSYKKYSTVFHNRPAKILNFHQTALIGDETAQPMDLPSTTWLSCHFGVC